MTCPRQCNVHWNYPGGQGLPGYGRATLDEFLELIDTFSGRRVHLYFCLSRQRIQNNRTKKAALAFRSIYIDIDLKKNPDDDRYETVDEAVPVVFDFCIAVGIPFPSIMVFSGGGLHLYWCSDRTLKADEWKFFADGLKAGEFIIAGSLVPPLFVKPDESLRFELAPIGAVSVEFGA